MALKRQAATLGSLAAFALAGMAGVAPEPAVNSVPPLWTTIAIAAIGLAGSGTVGGLVMFVLSGPSRRAGVGLTEAQTDGAQASAEHETVETAAAKFDLFARYLTTMEQMRDSLNKEREDRRKAEQERDGALGLVEELGRRLTRIEGDLETANVRIGELQTDLETAHRERLDAVEHATRATASLVLANERITSLEQSVQTLTAQLRNVGEGA